MNVCTTPRALFLLLSLLASASTQAWASDHQPPRVALMPVSAPPGYEELGRRLTRELRRAFDGLADVVEIKPGSLEEPPETCIYTTRCVDQVLEARQAEALLTGRVEPDADGESLDSRVLVLVVAPGWPVSYAESWAEPDAPDVIRTARQLLLTAQGRAEPGQAQTQGVPAGQDEEGDENKDEFIGDDGLRDEELMPIRVRSREKRARERRARLEEQRQEKAARQEKRMDKKQKRRDEKAKRPPVKWPQRRPSGPWRGWAFEVQGGAAHGAMGLSADSQVAGDPETPTDQYRWAVRSVQSGWSLQLGAGRSVGRKLEVGLEAGFLPAFKELQLYYQPTGEPVYEATQAETGFHVLAGARIRWFPLVLDRFHLYVGAGACLWLTPGFSDIGDETTGPHADFGPFLRYALEPAFGVRFLLLTRLYLGLETRVLVDPAGPLLEPLTNQVTLIPVPELLPLPPAESWVGSMRLSLGWLW